MFVEIGSLLVFEGIADRPGSVGRRAAAWGTVDSGVTVVHLAGRALHGAGSVSRLVWIVEAAEATAESARDELCIGKTCVCRSRHGLEPYAGPTADREFAVK